MKYTTIFECDDALEASSLGWTVWMAQVHNRPIAIVRRDGNNLHVTSSSLDELRRLELLHLPVL